MRWIYYVRCGECHSDNVWYDEDKGELFCHDCGLILEERFRLISIPDVIDYVKLQERQQREAMMEKLKSEEGR